MTAKSMRLAYADPPYMGQAKRHYAKDASGLCAEVNFPLLFSHLAGFDGWAMSASSTSLRALLCMAPDNCRVAAWVKPFCSWKPSHRVQYAWEPVLFVAARPKGSKSVPSVRDWHSANITLKRGTHGAKPKSFSLWVRELLGWQEGDELHDIFPGSGAVSEAWRNA